MNDGTKQPKKNHKYALIKAVVFVLFIGAAVSIIHFTSLRQFFNQEALSHFLEETGFWAPLIFVLIYAAEVCLFVPGTLLTALGAAFLVRTGELLYVWVGAMAGASAAFWIGRTARKGLCSLSRWSHRRDEARGEADPHAYFSWKGLPSSAS